MNPDACHSLRPRCDCAGPQDCLFAGPAPERPSLLIVWIFGAVVVAIVAVVLIVVVW